MCVIIIVDNEGGFRPDEKMLDAAWAQNGDGAGLAWREPARSGNGLEVVWEKGLGLTRAKELAASVPLPYVIHFRSASQGGVWANLTHPFEVSEFASDDLKGRTASPVLFHNGTWAVWPENAFKAAVRSGVGVPFGMWSDSRALAWMSTPGICGYGLMSLLPEQRGVMFATDWINVFRGPGWVKMKDLNDHEFWCSNDRSWRTGNQVGPHYGGHNQRNDVSNVKICAYGQCKRKDNLDASGYCGDHVGGKEKKATTSVLAGGPGAADPFHLEGQVRQITMEEVQDLFNAERISKNLYKASQNLFDRATNPTLTTKQRLKAQSGLGILSRALIGSGRLPLTSR